MAAKGGGFFNLFDWNKKSRKKLFASGSGSPDGKKQIRRNNENLPSTRFHLLDDDEDNDTAMLSVKESSDYSCASSVTDGEGNGSRAPGVVARLMGLDSLPTNGASEPCSTPSFESRYTREREYLSRGPEFEARNQFTEARRIPDSYTGKLPDWKFQRMPSSPVERFQREILPPRSVKSLPLTHHKLLSPIKNPRFIISSKDAAHIMETAVKILEPGFQINYRGKIPQADPSSVPLSYRDSKEYLATPQRISKHLDMSRAPTESNALKCLQGKPLSRSWNGSEGTSSCRSSPGRDPVNCAASKSKGKTVSLAIQAKVNVQKREGRSQPVPMEQDEISWGQLFKSHTGIVDNRLQKKNLSLTPSSVLKQNNQKQNCQTSKDKLSAKRSLPRNHNHGRKVFASASDKSKSLNKMQGTSNSKVGCTREGLQSNDTMKEMQSSRIDGLPRKKRLIDGSQQMERRVYGNNISVSRTERSAHENAAANEKSKIVENTKEDSRDMESFAFTSPPIRHKFSPRFPVKAQKIDSGDGCHFDNKGRNIQANIIIGEKLKQAEDNMICETDVASFTFTSPLLKPTFGPGSSSKMGKNSVTVSSYINECSKEQIVSGAENKKWSSAGLSMLGEDSLSIILEQKLRALAFDSESYVAPSFKFSPSDIQTSRNSPCSESTTLYEKMEQSKSWQSDDAKISEVPNLHISSFGGQVLPMKHEIQADNFMECSSSSSCGEFDHHASPFSVLEANFSNDSCNSYESYDSNYGIRSCSSVLAQNAGPSNTTLRISKVDDELDLSDSASSIKVTMNGDSRKRTPHRRRKTEIHCQEIEYVNEILYMANVNPRYFFIGRTSEKLDPLLFNLLESKKIASTESTEACSLKRKLLFDCVRECLDLTQGRYFRAGYGTWARGMLVVRRENLPEEIYGEISAWEDMGDQMVDELVDKSMSRQLGKSENFESDAFEIGTEIEKKILANLIDEIVLDLMT